MEHDIRGDCSKSATPPSRIATELEGQINVIAKLEETVDGLQKRLEPILGQPEGTAGEIPEKEMPSGSEIATALQTRTRKINECIDRIRIIDGRLEI